MRWPFELLANFPVQLALISAILLAAAMVVLSRVGIALAAVSLLVSAAPVVITLSTHVRPARAGSDRFTLACLNAQSGHIDATALRAQLLRSRPGIFIVLDPAPTELDELERKLPGYTTYATSPRFLTTSDRKRAVLLSRVPLSGVRHPIDAAFGPSAVELSFRLNGKATSLLAIGSEAPTNPTRAGHRNRILDAAARWSRQQQTQHDQVVVIGDFNATPWSPVFRRLEARGRLHSSLDGFGIQPSWPISNVLVRIPIDHALLSYSLVATARGTGGSFGSEHRSLRVTIAAAR